jgi:hypothetical protein
MFDANRTRGKTCHHYEVFCLTCTAPGIFNCVACCGSPPFEVCSSKRANSKKAEPKKAKRLKADSTEPITRKNIAGANSGVDMAVAMACGPTGSESKVGAVLVKPPSIANSSPAQHIEFKSKGPQRSEFDNKAQTVESVMRAISSVCAAFDRIALENEMMDKFMHTFSLEEDVSEDLCTINVQDGAVTFDKRLALGRDGGAEGALVYPPVQPLSFSEGLASAAPASTR